jgi:hypothetical protein
MPNSRIIFWPNVICTKNFLLTEEDIQSIATDDVESDVVWKGDLGLKGPWMGRLILFGNKVKRRVGNRTDIITSFTSEIERIVALRDLFGVKIDEEDIIHIKGRDAAL